MGGGALSACGSRASWSGGAGSFATSRFTISGVVTSGSALCSRASGSGVKAEGGDGSTFNASTGASSATTSDLTGSSSRSIRAMASSSESLSALIADSSIGGWIVRN
jgi:hypothetical protein